MDLLIFMGKIITISDKAYNMLKKVKERENKTFGEAIEYLIEKRAK